MTQRVFTATALTVLLFVPALLRADDVPKGDKDLDGDWTGVSAFSDGDDLGKPPGGRFVLTVKGDAITIQIGDETHTGKAKIDPAKTPKVIDMVPDDGPEKGKTVPGVYEIKGDELRICTAEPDKDRPTEVSSKKGSGWMLITCKRVKK